MHKKRKKGQKKHPNFCRKMAKNNHRKTKETRDYFVGVRLKKDEYEMILHNMETAGYLSLSKFVRDSLVNKELKIKEEKFARPERCRRQCNCLPGRDVCGNQLIFFFLEWESGQFPEAGKTQILYSPAAV